MLYDSEDYPNSNDYLELVEELKYLTEFGKTNNIDLALERSDPTLATIALDTGLDCVSPRFGKLISLGIQGSYDKLYEKYDTGERMFEYAQYKNAAGEKPPYRLIKDLVKAEVDILFMIKVAKGAFDNINPTPEMIRQFIESKFSDKYAKIFEVFGTGTEGILENVIADNFSEILRNISRKKLRTEGYI